MQLGVDAMELHQGLGGAGMQIGRAGQGGFGGRDTAEQGGAGMRGRDARMQPSGAGMGGDAWAARMQHGLRTAIGIVCSGRWQTESGSVKKDRFTSRLGDRQAEHSVCGPGVWHRR